MSLTFWGKDEEAPAELVPWINTNKSCLTSHSCSNRIAKRHTVAYQSLRERASRIKHLGYDDGNPTSTTSSGSDHPKSHWTRWAGTERKREAIVTAPFLWPRGCDLLGRLRTHQKDLCWHDGSLSSCDIKSIKMILSSTSLDQHWWPKKTVRRKGLSFLEESDKQPIAPAMAQTSLSIRIINLIVHLLSRDLILSFSQQR